MSSVKKMSAIHEEAYMNGYNWEALLNYYLSAHSPEVPEGMDTDPEAGIYAAHFPPTKENEAKAEKLAQTIRFLVENEEVLYRIVREEGDKIAWEA